MAGSLANKKINGSILCNTFRLAIFFIISFQLCHNMYVVYKMFLGFWREFKELQQTNQVSNLHFV